MKRTRTYNRKQNKKTCPKDEQYIFNDDTSNDYLSKQNEQEDARVYYILIEKEFSKLKYQFEWLKGLFF